MVSEQDRRFWEGRYHGQPLPEPGLPALFTPHAGSFPDAGHALELACGTGAASVWLGARGLRVVGVDGSPSAIEGAWALARSRGVACRFQVFDLDAGLPPGPPADVILCHMFRDPRLYGPIVERLAAGGLLAFACLSEVGVGPGRFRAAAGELKAAFAPLAAVAAGEGEGRAWIIARKASGSR